MEQSYGHQNPLNSVTKLHNILTRCPKGRVDLEWVLTLLWDCLQAKDYEPKSLTVAAIKGANNGNKGVCQLLLLKRELGNYLNQEILQKMPFSTQAKVQLPKVMSHPAMYRVRLKPLPGSSAEPDLDWAAGLNKADLALRDFWEARPYVWHCMSTPFVPHVKRPGKKDANFYY